MTIKIYNDIEQLDDFESKNIGVIIGNFDGVHLGHQKLIENFLNKCSERNAIPIVVTFDPHPALFLNEKLGAFLICNKYEKYTLLEKYGVKSVIELKFDGNLQRLSADDFIENFLLKIPHVCFFQLGHDFSLGQGKVPAGELLKQKVNNTNIEVFECEAFKLDRQIVSSTLIRELISNGSIERVNELLNRPYSLTERVINGYGVGRKELVPTANIQVHPQQLHPKSGVYFTQTTFDGNVYASVTNIGIRPSLVDDSGLSIETNILNFSKNIYEESIKIEFLKFHRNEKKFSSKAELLAQIQADIKARSEYQ